MDKEMFLEQIWGDVKVPVLVLQEAEGCGALVFQNRAAEDLASGNRSVLELLPSEEASELCGRAGSLCGRTTPFFCHIGEEIFSAWLFAWNAYIVCMLHNVTDYQRGVQSQLDEAVMASRAKTNFLSEMSHDIRTPMNAIIGMTDIALVQKETPPRIRDYLSKIKIASGHMMSIINEVLDMSRIESGKIVLQPEKVDIADLLHEILIVARPQADAKNQKFRVEIGRIDNEQLILDGLRLKQVILNLLSNAIKFTPDGGEILLYFQICREEGADPVLDLYVRDTGIGMSKEFLSRVFKPFEREQSLTISKIQGTGLGTAIAKNMVELMGGQIRVESEPQKGSCFYVSIPAEASDIPLEKYREALAGRHLLLLDGDDARAQQIREMTRKAGVLVDWAKNPEQAVAFINNTIFSDFEYFAFLAAEKVEGVEMMSFLPQIRQRMGSEFPILLLSGSDWTQTEYMFTRAGVDAFIPLPLFASRLYAGLYAFTGQGKTKREAQLQAQQRRFDGRHILLVEDNELNREIAQEILSMTGVEVTAAQDGQQALERFLEKPPFYYDLILMDIQMPVMNGLEATKALRAMDRPDASEVPIIAMTANAFVEDVKNSLDAGMDAHVPKPLDMDVIFDCLERFLGRRVS